MTGDHSHDSSHSSGADAIVRGETTSRSTSDDGSPGRQPPGSPPDSLSSKEEEPSSPHHGALQTNKTPYVIRTKLNKTRAFEEVYPDANLPPTRESIMKIIDSGSLSYIIYPYKTIDDPHNEDVLAMRSLCEFEFQRHFIALGTNKTVFQAIKTALPHIDLSSTVAVELRKYLIQRFAEWKFDFLCRRLYAYVLNQFKQYKAELNQDPTTPQEKLALFTFFAAQLDSELFRYIYGDSHCQVIKVDVVFASENEGKDKKPIWYFRQLFVNLCVKILPLVKSELELNKTSGPYGTPLPWAARLPKDTNFVFDERLRRGLINFFDSIPTKEAFEKVELDLFPWNSYADVSKKRAARTAEDASRKHVALGYTNKGTPSTISSPVVGSSFGNARGSSNVIPRDDSTDELPLSISYFRSILFDRAGYR